MTCGAAQEPGRGIALVAEPRMMRLGHGMNGESSPSGRKACAGLGLALLLLLGACAGGSAPPEPAAPPIQAATGAPVANGVADTAAVPAPDDAIGDLLVGLKGNQRPLAVSLTATGTQATAPAAATRRAGTEVGYLLIDLESGRALAELNADLTLIPASTAKLATAAVALDVLGPEHRFRTELLATGTIDEGVLRGDLILKGGGDPSLDVADLLELVVRLEMSGIRYVEGRFLIDDLALPRLSEIEPTQPGEAPYNPGIGALSLAFNRVQVAWRGGGSMRVATLPPLAEARFRGAPPSLLPPGGIELMSADGDGVVWRIANRGGGRQEASLPVKDPGLHTGGVFRWLAFAQGIEVGPPQRAPTPPDARLLAVHDSVPLRRLLRDMLVYSNNVMAELIGLSTAGRLGDVSSGLDAAGALLVGHLARMMPEVDWRGAALGNHSGLDGAARMTPRQLAAILHHGWHSHALPALLAAGGWSGTLTNRFADSDQALRVWAKTGTMHYGSALAGYLFSDGVRPLIFVTMVSDLGARAAYDDALPHPGRRAEAAAQGWSSRARALQDELIESWLAPLPTS
jgi:D-alanyl-D-alanine carboxypeptidase/D-alanyl-D-alanine-endopeptidase (penicillin-binding protein 4)